MKLNLQPYIDRRIKRFDALQDECGVTRVSLENAYQLLHLHGVPYSIDLIRELNEWNVVVKWMVAPSAVSHKFTGFSWGYRGEGPNGLLTFMESLGLEGPAGWTPYQSIGENKTHLRLLP